MSDQEKTDGLSDNTPGQSAPVKPRKSSQKQPPRLLPPWRVLLHNDDVNEVENVVKVVHQLTPLSKEESLVRTMEAHKSGVALLLVTHQERAELYVEQFASFTLTVTAEPER